MFADFPLNRSMTIIRSCIPIIRGSVGGFGTPNSVLNFVAKILDILNCKT